MDIDWVCVVFLSALKEMKMESGGRNGEPFGLAKLSFHGTRLWMLWDGYVFSLCCQVKKDLKWLFNLTWLKAVVFAITSWSQLTIMCYCLCIYLHRLITSSPHFKVRLTCELSNCRLQYCLWLLHLVSCGHLTPFVVKVMTVESMCLHRALLRFCSCRSAGGSIPSSPQALSQVQTLEPWQLPPPCTSVATASCLRSVSRYHISQLSSQMVHFIHWLSLSPRCF